MCRLFAPELIEAIATGKPPAPGAIEAIAAHIRRDWTAAGCVIDFLGEGSSQVCRTLAMAATVGSGDMRRLSDKSRLELEAGRLGIRTLSPANK